VSNPQNHWANNFQVNADNAYPFTGSNQSTIKWQTFGSTNWQSITATNFFIGPVAIQQVIVFTNNDTLCCIGAAYVPAFLYTLSAGNTTVLGQPQGSLYDLIYTNNAGGIEGKRVFFSGYDGCLLDYNPTNPWTLTVSVTNQGALGVNPRNVAAGSAKVGEHYYYTCFGSDGWVYSACDEIRNAGNGSAIAWYDPVSKSVGSFRDRALTNDFTPTDLKPVLGGTKLVFVDTSGSFYVFDVATKTLVATNTPLGGIPLDKVVEVAPGIIFGATGSNIFLASVTNSAVFYTNTLPGNAFCVSGNLYQSQERLTLGPDGYIWLFVNNSLYRINPLVGTNTMTNILNTTARTMIFDGGDLIMFRNFDVNLYRIKNLLVPLVPPPILLTGAAKLPNGAFQFAFTNTPVGTNYITTNITTTITTNWSKWGPPKITGYTTNTTTTLTTNGSANTATVLTTTNLLLPLTNWTVLGTVTDNPPGQFQFTDPQATNHPLRFYRVRSP
jgi:hypothetical protein